MEVCKQEVPPDVSIDDVLIKCHLYSGVEATSDEDITEPPSGGVPRPGTQTHD
jgi:hypothetical protein